MTEALLFSVTGTLRAQPIVRSRVVGNSQQALPVLTLTLDDVGRIGQSVTAEQVFPAGQHAAAMARAHQLKPGTRLTVQAPLALLQLHMPQVQHIYTEKQNQQEATHA